MTFGKRMFVERKLNKRDAKKKVFGSTNPKLVGSRTIPKRFRNRLLSVSEIDERQYGDPVSHGKRLKDYREKDY